MLVAWGLDSSSHAELGAYVGREPPAAEGGPHHALSSLPGPPRTGPHAKQELWINTVDHHLHIPRSL